MRDRGTHLRVHRIVMRRQIRVIVALFLLTSAIVVLAEAPTQDDAPEEPLSAGDIALRDAAPDSEVAQLAAELESRIAAGEMPPHDIQDLNFQLVNCSGLSDSELATEGYLAIGFDSPGIACENTKGGQQLLERRRWECATRPSRSCICGKKTRYEFFYFLNSQFGAPSFGPAMKQFSLAMDGSKNSAYFKFKRPVTYSECSYAVEDESASPAQ